MKKITLAVMCLFSLAAFSQSDLVDVIIDGQPAKLNMTTGEYKFTGAKPNYNTSNTNAGIQNSSGNVHTVSKGETLYSISKQYAISMAQIKSVNNLTTNMLKVGQELNIGYSNTNIIQENSSDTHIVAKGETLYRIAKNASISVSQLKALNNLSTNIITVGQVLKLK